MDPDACLERILDSLRREDYEEAQDATTDLENWLAREGSAPELQFPRRSGRDGLVLGMVTDHSAALTALLLTGINYHIETMGMQY